MIIVTIFNKYFYTWDQRLRCLILCLSFRWTIILFPQGKVHVKLPPYGVIVFNGGSSSLASLWTELQKKCIKINTFFILLREMRVWIQVAPKMYHISIISIIGLPSFFILYREMLNKKLESRSHKSFLKYGNI